MGLQLRISRTNRRPTLSGPGRRLLHSEDVLESPTTFGPVCEALEPDGLPCKADLAPEANDPWCTRHYSEWKELIAQWSKTYEEANKAVVFGSDSAKQKVIQLRLSVNLRRQIRDRFYPRGGDIQDYINWIAQLETDIRQLADSLLGRTRPCLCARFD
jgi:hypothetical protein